MLHDVIVEIYEPGIGANREVIQLHAAGGDDAAAQAAVEAARIAVGRVWRIISVAPAAAPETAPALPLKGKKAKPAPVAEVEGADFPDEPGV